MDINNINAAESEDEALLRARELLSHNRQDFIDLSFRAFRDQESEKNSAEEQNNEISEQTADESGENAEESETEGDSKAENINPEMDIEEVKELYERYKGQKCQVTSTDNAFLFLGTIAAFEREHGEIRVETTRDEPTPKSDHNSTVKLMIKLDKTTKIIYGKVTGQSNEFWRIRVTREMEFNENRESFRQVVSVLADVTSFSTGQKSGCKILDISLTGVSFRSDIDFSTGDVVLITNVILHEKCPTVYSFPCIVRRIFKDALGRDCCGCSFDNLAPSIEQTLSRDLFFIQALSMKSK